MEATTVQSPHIYTRLIPYRVERRCGIGGCLGKMEASSHCPSPGLGPTMWEHECSVCKRPDEYEDRYPYIKHSEA